MATTDVEVKFGANVTAVDSGIHHIEGELRRLGQSVRGISNGFADMGRAILGAFTISAGAALVVSLGEIGETAERTSEMLGMTVEQVTALQYATIISGQGAEQMTSIMGRLARAMDAAASGGKQQIAAFKQVGVEYRDAEGNLRPLQDMLYDIADRFAGARNGAEKTALAMELMGRSGAEAIPLLNRGSAGLRQFAEEAKRAGVLLTADVAHAMGETGDKIDDLGQSFLGLAIRIFTQMKPAIDVAVDAMRSLVQSINGESITAALGVIVDAVASVMVAFAEMGAFITKIMNDIGVRAAVWNAVGIGMFNSGAEAAMHLRIEQMNAETDAGLKKNLAMFAGWKEGIKTLIGGGRGNGDRVGAGVGGGAGGGEEGLLPAFKPPPPPTGTEVKAIDASIAGILKMGQALDIQTQALGMSTAAGIAFTQEEQVKNQALALGITLTAKQTADIHKYAVGVGVATEKLQYMTAVQDQMRGIAQGIASAFGEWMNGTSSLGDALIKMTLQLAAAVAEALLLNIILAAMGLTPAAGSMGAVISGLFGGGKAEGGPLTAGKWYMAGERGPEPIWGGGVGAEAAGYGPGMGGGGGGMGGGADPQESAQAIGRALQPHFAQLNYTQRLTSRTIQEFARRIRR